MANFRRGVPETAQPGGTLLVDGTNLAMRAVKLVEGKGVDLSSGGINTGPLVIFINAITKYARDLVPERMVVCFDGGRSPWRMNIFPEYKGDRPHGGYDNTFVLAKEFLSLSNVHHVTFHDVEADDIIAHYWRTERGERRVTILSGDKDFLQLVEGDTALVQPGNDRVWTHPRIQQELECEPGDLPNVKALTGDASDCIPGVPGFGHITAVKALRAHEWRLDALLATDDVKWKKKIEGFEARALMNRDLMNLREQPQPLIAGLPLADLESPPAFDPTDVTGLLRSDLIDFMRRYQLASIESRMRDERLWRN